MRNTPAKGTPYQKKIEEYQQDLLKEAHDFDLQLTDKTVTRIVCRICGKKQPRDKYMRNYSLGNLYTINKDGEIRSGVCTTCSRKLFAKYQEEFKDDVAKAFNKWCQILDIYYDSSIVAEAVRTADPKSLDPKNDLTACYMRVLGLRRLVGLTYWDSPLLGNQRKLEIEANKEYYDQIAEELNSIEDLNVFPEEIRDWNKEDLNNYSQVLEWYKYDPFKDEPLEDRRKLYHNLVGFSDPDIIEDTGKATACIDMCRSIQRLEKLNKKRILMENDDKSSIKDLKMLAELQEKERKGIQQYQKEWGFNARYSMNKAQGAGTLTGIMKEMDEKMFEDALPNAYDIKTSEAMVMAAEASWKGIFSQLNISESEFSEVVKHQRETITELRRELDDTKEELRLANVELKRQELQERLRKQGGDAE